MCLIKIKRTKVKKLSKTIFKIFASNGCILSCKSKNLICFIFFNLTDLSVCELTAKPAIQIIPQRFKCIQITGLIGSLEMYYIIVFIKPVLDNSRCVNGAETTVPHTIAIFPPCSTKGWKRLRRYAFFKRKHGFL